MVRFSFFVKQRSVEDRYTPHQMPSVAHQPSAPTAGGWPPATVGRLVSCDLTTASLSAKDAEFLGVAVKDRSCPCHLWPNPLFRSVPHKTPGAKAVARAQGSR